MPPPQNTKHNNKNFHKFDTNKKKPILRITKKMSPQGSMSNAGGVYSVTESGVHLQHLPSPPTPKDGQEFLERFR